MSTNDRLLTPPYIEECLTPDFLHTLKEECESIFGHDVLLRDDGGVVMLQPLAGTNGYAEALQRTCERLNTPQIMEFWNSLEWYDSDAFDSDLIDRIGSLFSNEENKGGASHGDRS